VYADDTDHPTDLIFDLATGTAEVRDHTSKSGEPVVITRPAKVQEFPTKLRFTWQQPPLVPEFGGHQKVTFDVDRSTLTASESSVDVGGNFSGHVSKIYSKCTVEKMPKIKNKI